MLCMRYSAKANRWQASGTARAESQRLFAGIGLGDVQVPSRHPNAKPEEAPSST